MPERFESRRYGSSSGGRLLKLTQIELEELQRAAMDRPIRNPEILKSIASKINEPDAFATAGSDVYVDWEYVIKNVSRLFDLSDIR